MHPDLTPLVANLILIGEIGHDVAAFLRYHGCPATAEHCAAVAAEARSVALIAGANPEDAAIAGWLHDVSAVWPAAERVAVAARLGVPILPEEAAFPMIIHQKLSAVLAEQVFRVSNPDILSAVGCHTTLKAGAGLLDMVLFVADKLAWDQPGRPPWEAEIRAALGNSVQAAAGVYLTHLWERRATLRVVHPWLRDAYLELAQP